MIKTAIDTVKAESRSYLFAFNEATHLNKLRRFNKHLPYKQTNLKLLETLGNNGFALYVNTNIAKMFTYVASVMGNTVFFIDKRAYPSNIQYIGDIPNEAILEIERARQSSIKYMSIHSNDPLPTWVEQIDPILIGWCKNPHFVAKTEDGQYSKCNNFTIGVLLAAWNMKKEFLIGRLLSKEG